MKLFATVLATAYAGAADYSGRVEIFEIYLDVKFRGLKTKARFQFRVITGAMPVPLECPNRQLILRLRLPGQCQIMIHGSLIIGTIFMIGRSPIRPDSNSLQ